MAVRNYEGGIMRKYSAHVRAQYSTMLSPVTYGGIIFFVVAAIAARMIFG
jgi:hypothetical protein